MNDDNSVGIRSKTHLMSFHNKQIRLCIILIHSIFNIQVVNTIHDIFFFKGAIRGKVQNKAGATFNGITVVYKWLLQL